MTETVEMKEYVDRRFEDQEKAVQAALAAAKDATQAALASAQMAVDKAEAGDQKWRDASNEWRNAMNDRERNFLTRKEFYSIVLTAVSVMGVVLAVRP